MLPLLPAREAYGNGARCYPGYSESSPDPTVETRWSIWSILLRTHEDSGRHAISSATDHSRCRGVCFHRRWFVTGSGVRWHHGGGALPQRCSRPNGRASLERNPGDSKGAWDNSAAGRRPTASRSRPTRRPEGGDEKACRADHDVDRET